jgi:hypothetical protein
MNEPIRDDKTGQFAGSKPGLGSKIQIPKVSRDLRLGVPVERTSEVDRYLRLRAKYDKANASRQDILASVSEQRQQQNIMMEVIHEAESIKAESALVGWEFYELSREAAGAITPDFPYDPSVVKIVTDSFLESSSTLNPDSAREFLPIRATAFNLLGDREDGYDLSYDEYLDGRYVAHRGAIAIGAKVDYIGFGISAKDQKAYVPFSAGKELAGLPTPVSGAKPEEKIYYSVSDIHALERIVSKSPKVLKIKSIRYFYPLRNEAIREISLS